MRIALVLLFLLCGGGVFAESQPPAPAPPKLSNPHQEQAKGNQGNTEGRPKFAPKSSCCPLNQKQPAENTNKANNSPPTDWWAWALTFALVIVGIIQACIYGSQLRHFRRTDRPYIFATVEHIKDKSIFNADGSCKLFIVAHFKNHGKTPAILKNINVTAEIQRDTPPKKFPKQVIETQKIPEGLVVGADGEHTANRILEITAQDWQAIGKYTIWLTCFGILRYMDTASNKIRETSFHWHYYPFENQKRFFITNNDEWNYYT